MTVAIYKDCVMQYASERIQKFGLDSYDYEEIRKEMWKEDGIAQGLAEYHGHPLRVIKTHFYTFAHLKRRPILRKNIYKYFFNVFLLLECFFVYFFVLL